MCGRFGAMENTCPGVNCTSSIGLRSSMRMAIRHGSPVPRIDPNVLPYGREILATSAV